MMGGTGGGALSDVSLVAVRGVVENPNIVRALFRMTSWRYYTLCYDEAEQQQHGVTQ